MDLNINWSIKYSKLFKKILFLFKSVIIAKFFDFINLFKSSKIMLLPSRK